MYVRQASKSHGHPPAEPAGFIGRESELAHLHGLLGRARLVTVTGPAGVGKTRIALRAAARAASRFADGVCLVELSALRDPALLPHAVASALGLPERSPAIRGDAVLGYLRERNLLLILDTCEHLINACAVFAAAVIAGAPGVTLLATSREPLDVIGENSCPIPPLPVPGEHSPPHLGGTAVDLFLQRADASAPGHTITTGQLPDIVRLCQRLDGIPLAIELAAVSLHAFPLAELADRMDALLASGQRGGRHRTLRDAISWSYELCTPAEQALWARLSVFAGSVCISAAEEVCADAALDRDQVMTTMIRLVDKSVLARADPAAGDRDGQPARYRMLNTIREFGAEQLTAGRTGIRNQFIARYLAMAQRFHDHFLDDDQLDRLRELRREHVNVRAALEYTLESGEHECAADGVELATVLCSYWCACGRAGEGAYWLGKAVERAPAGTRARGRALLARAHLNAIAGNADAALTDAAEGLRLGGELSDEWLVAHGYLVSNLTLSMAGRLAEAAKAAQQAEPRLRTLDARRGLASLQIQRTYLALLNGDAGEALECVQRGLRLLRGSPGDGERWLHASLFQLGATALFMAGRDIESASAAARSLRIKQEIDDIPGIAFALEIHGWLAARDGRQRRAAWLLGGAAPLWRRTGCQLVLRGLLERLHAEAVARASEALGQTRFDALYAQAACQPRDQLATFALDNTDKPASDGGARVRLPGQLTAREHEVATLVAEGLSNRQIAEKLFISRRTVDAHVEHIFAKLGIASRAQLASVPPRSPGVRPAR